MELIAPILIFAATYIAWKLLDFLVFSNLYALKIPTIQPAHPILGHLLVFTRKNLQQAFHSLVQLFESVDRVAKLRMGPLPILLVNHPDVVKELLKRDELFDKPVVYGLLELGRGLVTERCGKTWHYSRKVLNPTFSTKILHEFIPIMDATAKKMVKDLDASVKATESELDVFPVLSQCTLEMVFSTTMGCKVDDREGAKEFIECLEKLLVCVNDRILNVDQYFEPIYKRSKLYSTAKACKDFCFEFGGKITQERKKEMLENTNFWRNLTSDDGIQAKSMNFLDQILTIKKPDGSSFSDEEVSEHLATIVVAGNETTALSTAYACLNLAMDQAAQSKVFEEIKQVFHSPSVEVTPETLKQLVYLEMVIKETLRLYCPIPFMGRATAAPIHLDGIRIPKGVPFIFSFYNLHRRKDFWGDDVERFDPERFRPELVKERHPFAFVPFSAGYRNCIGGRYAMLSIKVMLLRIVQSYELSTSLRREDLQFNWAISLKLVGPHAVRLKKRNLNC